MVEPTLELTVLPMVEPTVLPLEELTGHPLELELVELMEPPSEEHLVYN